MKSNMESKVFRAAMVLLCGAGLAMSSAMAQQGPPQQGPPPDSQMQGPPPGQYRGRGGMNPEHRVEMLQKRLDLSADQTTQVKAIFEGERSKMEALRSNTSQAPQDRRSQMMAIRQDGETQLQALLNPEQKTKYAQMQAMEQQRMQERRQEGAGGGQPPPPPPPQQ
jgi:protein CpxP